MDIKVSPFLYALREIREEQAEENLYGAANDLLEALSDACFDQDLSNPSPWLEKGMKAICKARGIEWKPKQ